VPGVNGSPSTPVDNPVTLLWTPAPYLWTAAGNRCTCLWGTRPASCRSTGLTSENGRGLLWTEENLPG